MYSGAVNREFEMFDYLLMCALVYAGTSMDEVQHRSTINLEDSSNICYSLWVSFAEIYNEFIYDLLGEEPKTAGANMA